jgi:hypothetical protein
MLTHEASGVVVVGADLSVNLDKTLSNDEGDLTASQSILELVLKEDLECIVCSASSCLSCVAKLTDRGRDSLSL